MEAIGEFLDKYFKTSTLSFSWNDALEIIIFAVLIYNVILWIKRTKTWILLKGSVAVGAVYLIAYILRLNNILFVFHYITTYIVIGAIVIFQPEIRKALEHLGNKVYFSKWLSLGDNKEKQRSFTSEMIDAIARAAQDLGRTRTGALIVIEKNILLNEYIATGIKLNADITAPLLEQIFEHNTPLHDGAVIIRGEKIMAATCYLPLSENKNISKELGTRHRAGLGISEVSDSVTVIVSEETGAISIAQEGKLYRNLDIERLRRVLNQEQRKMLEHRRLSYRKGKQKNENKNN